MLSENQIIDGVCKYLESQGYRMTATKPRAFEIIRRIRDRHARQLTGKTGAEIVAFYRAAGEAATEDLRQHSKPRKRRTGQR